MSTYIVRANILFDLKMRASNPEKRGPAEAATSVGTTTKRRVFAIRSLTAVVRATTTISSQSRLVSKNVHSPADKKVRSFKLTRFLHDGGLAVRISSNILHVLTIALDYCSLPRVPGNCTEKQPRWYYDTPQKRCMPFYYSGCNGNRNNFVSRESCETDCPREVRK